MFIMTGHCDIQPWARAALLTAVPRLNQSSALRGKVKWVSVFRLSNNNNKWQ